MPPRKRSPHARSKSRSKPAAIRLSVVVGRRWKRRGPLILRFESSNADSPRNTETSRNSPTFAFASAPEADASVRADITLAFATPHALSTPYPSASLARWPLQIHRPAAETPSPTMPRSESAGSKPRPQRRARPPRLKLFAPGPLDSRSVRNG